MSYYKIMINPDARKICSIILFSVKNVLFKCFICKTIFTEPIIIC